MELNMSTRLKDKVSIITGGAQGIGEATSRIFSDEGSKVIIVDLDETKGMLLKDEINSNNGDASFFKLNVADEKGWDKLVSDVINKWGKINVLVNNAGLSGAKGRAVVEETTLSNWNDVFAVNSTAIMLGTRAVIPHMRNIGGGSIINVSSIFGIVGSPAGAAYHASKGAARIFSKGAAVQYGKDNIRVNSIHPGFTDTPMTLDIHSQKEIRDHRLAMTPLGRLGLPKDIAYGILYLASDESSWVTGTELVVDGGETAW